MIRKPNKSKERRIIACVALVEKAAEKTGGQFLTLDEVSLQHAFSLPPLTVLTCINSAQRVEETPTLNFGEYIKCN